MYFGANKEEGYDKTDRVAVIRFTDDEYDLYKYIENYEHTYGDKKRKFACGGLVGIERNEKGVWINESYISVDDFTDFNDLKANYKEAKKEFKSLKKQATETKPETATDSETTEAEETTGPETTEAEETTDPEVGKFVYDVRVHNAYGWDTYTVAGDDVESAEYKALKRVEYECGIKERSSIDVIRIYKEGTNDLLKEIITKEIEEPETETSETEGTSDQCETTHPEILKPLEIIFDDENSKSEIRTKFYLLETFNRLNINHYYVELMTDKKIGDFYLYLKFDENSNEEIALCKIFHLNAEYRNNAFETRFLYALAEKYNGLYCTPDYDDFAYYKKIADECKTPETFEPFFASGEKCFHISLEKIKPKTEICNKYDETEDLLAVEKFERLTGTLFKSLFKAIGLEETRRIPIIISNNMVFFNYNGKQYKYNPAQCKVYKKDGRKYQRINWKDFTDDNTPSDQKQARGRSPPFTPDIRSTTIQ